MELVNKQEVMQTYKDFQPILATNVSKFGESLLAIPTIDAILKADYETRLKADLVAMLEEIDLEMSEQSFGIQTEPWEVVEKLRKEIIQQKINALKAETEEEGDK